MTITDGPTTTGEVVRLRREELGLTKAELARRAHLTRSSIHEIELGQRAHLQARTVRALEQVLELPPGSLTSTTSTVVALHDETSQNLEALRADLAASQAHTKLLAVIVELASRVEALERELD